MAAGFYKINKYTSVNIDDIETIAIDFKDDVHQVTLHSGRRLFIQEKEAKKLVEFLEEW